MGASSALLVSEGRLILCLWASGPTKPLLTNPYFGFLQFLAFVFNVFVGFVGAMAWPWPSHGPNKSPKITKSLKTAKIQSMG